MYPIYLLLYLMDYKIGMILLSLYYPCAFLGVLRTFYRHRRFAKCCTALSELNPQNRHRRFASCLFSMKRVSPPKVSLRLQATVRLVFATKVSKITVHAAYSPSASLSAWSALSELNPQKPAFGCKQLSGRLLLSRYQKSPYMPLIFDGL